MSYIFLEDERRLLDPESGHELLVLSGGSDMTKFFRLIGPDYTYDFTADMIFPEILPADRQRLGVAPNEEVVVWQIQNSRSAVEPEIKRAMLAFKSSGGYHYPGTVYFVKFGTKGDLRNG